MSLSSHSPDAILADLEGRLELARNERDLARRRLKAFTEATPKIPSWLTKVPRSKAKHHGTPVLMLSDLHLDEVVDLAEMNGINKYDREIAEQRLERVGERTITITRDHWSGTIYDGIVVVLGGDLFTGTIHDELRETNADTMPGSLQFWLPKLMQLLVRLADEFGKVHVVVIPGNHGRNTPKKRHKHNARDNWDWFAGTQLQWALCGVLQDKRFTFQVSDATDASFDVYDHRVLAFHGDETGGGQGIGGIWPPIMRMVHKKQTAHAAMGRRFDMAIMGHWHQITWGPNDSFLVNGSTKGYDEFAKNMNFSPEPAQQALWIMTPEHKITWRAALHLEDRVAEGW